MSRPSLRQQAYTQILAMIENGDLSKGAVTSEVHLSQVLDMSRTPVRAALQQLELEGYVRIASKHGVLILDSSSQRVGDLLDFIASMALFCVSAAFLSKAKELRDLSQEMIEAYQSHRSANPFKVQALIDFEYELIKRLIKLSNNNEMEKSYQTLISRLFWKQNEGRWRAPYSLQTNENIETLIKSISTDFESFRFALLDYIRTLKLTWQ